MTLCVVDFTAPAVMMESASPKLTTTAPRVQFSQASTGKGAQLQMQQD